MADLSLQHDATRDEVAGLSLQQDAIAIKERERDNIRAGSTPVAETPSPPSLPQVELPPQPRSDTPVAETPARKRRAASPARGPRGLRPQLAWGGAMQGPNSLEDHDERRSRSRSRSPPPQFTQTVGERSTIQRRMSKPTVRYPDPDSSDM